LYSADTQNVSSKEQRGGFEIAFKSVWLLQQKLP